MLDRQSWLVKHIYYFLLICAADWICCTEDPDLSINCSCLTKIHVLEDRGSLVIITGHRYPQGRCNKIIFLHTLQLGVTNFTATNIPSATVLKYAIIIIGSLYHLLSDVFKDTIQCKVSN